MFVVGTNTFLFKYFSVFCPYLFTNELGKQTPPIKHVSIRQVPNRFHQNLGVLWKSFDSRTSLKITLGTQVQKGPETNSFFDIAFATVLALCHSVTFL